LLFGDGDDFALEDWIREKMFAVVHLNQPSVEFFQQDAMQRYIDQKRMIITAAQRQIMPSKIH